MNGLNELDLLTKYRKAKEIEIERLFDQYGTSLAETREMYPQLMGAISERRKTTAFPTQPLFFTQEEAAQMNLNLQEGWMLKFTPVEGNGGYTSSFITPEKWEITENDLYISPTGEQYSKADLQAMLAEPSGLDTGITGIPTLENLTEEGKAQYQEYQAAGGELDVAGWIDLRERQQLETEQVFGAVFPKQDIAEVIDYMNENPEGFLADIREIGPTEDVVALLKMIEFKDEEGNIIHLTDAEIQELFGTAIVAPSIDMSKVRRLEPFPQTPIWATTTTPLDTVAYPGAYGEIPTVEDVPLKDMAYVFAGSIKQLPAQIGASVLQAVQGMNGASVVNRDWADEQITRANEDLNAFAQEIAGQYPNSAFLQDISQLSRNLAYSITTMGVGNLAALPLWLAPEPTAATKIAAATTAGIVSGWVSFRGTTYQIMQEYLELKNREKIAQTGQGLTLEEEDKLKADFHADAVKYGLWEAVPEGISNMIFSGILGGAFNNALTKIVGQNVAKQIASSLITKYGTKAFGIFGEELLTETITQKGQAAIEVEAGLREGNITWWEAFREIAPQTTLLTLIMFGAGQAIVKTTGAIRGKTSVANVDKIVSSLKDEIGEGNILYDELKQHIEEEIGKGTITEEDAKKILEAGLAENVLQDMRVAEEIKANISGRVTLTPSQYEEGLYSINVENIAESVGGIKAVIQGDSLFVNRISIHEKGVLTRSLLREIDTQLISMAQAQGLKYIKIAAKPQTMALYARAGYVQEEGTNVMTKEVTAEVPTTPAGRLALTQEQYRALSPEEKTAYEKRLDEAKDKANRAFELRQKARMPKYANQASEMIAEAEAIEASLREQGIEIVDHTGGDYDSGMALRVVTRQGEGDTIIETLKPTVRAVDSQGAWHILQAGDVIVGDKSLIETPAGMPEAGLQAGIPGMAAAEVVRPQPKGKLVQARIDDYLRLREYNKKAVSDRIEAIKKALEKKGRSELGLKGNLRLELARLEAMQELDAVESIQDLDSLIREVESELGLRSLPGRGQPARKGIKAARHPGVPNVFPEYTSRQLEEMLKVYQEARQKMAGEVPALTPAPKPEPTTEELNRVKTDPTPASDEIILKKFIDCIKDAKPAREVTEALKHQELSKRSAVFASILQGGEGYKAFEKAKGALKGFLPQGEYVLDLQKFGITDAEIERMIDRIRLDENLRPFEKLNTYEAFTNLVMGAIPTEGEIVLLEREFGPELAKAIMDKLPTREKVTRIALDIANIPRTLKTIADLSATLRQGATLAVGQPIQFVEAFKKELKVIFSEKNFKLIDEIIHNNPYADQAKRYKLYIAPIEEAVRIEAREEAFRGRLIERVPIVGSIVRASERAYITFLNVLRMETWAYYCKQWEGTNKSVKDYTDLASFINHATGRGDLGALSRAGSYLSAVFFSPRYVMSRVQLPLDLIKSTPAVRRIAARNLVSWVGANLLAIMLLKLAGADVEDDPRSSDFGKVRFGNTRIDFWAGFQPYVRNIAQIIAEERKSTRTGEVYEVDPIQIGVNFVRSKLAPIPGLLWSLKSGKTFIGEELTAENAESIIYQELTPLAVQDWIDAVKWSNEGASTLYGILSILGVGVQTWSNNWDTAQEQLGLPERSETAPYTIENDVYDMKDYYSEVGRMIGGATYEMLAERGDIPELVLMVARAKDAKNTISLLPNQRLTSINADPDEGDTFEQYRAQWMARQDITDEGELAKFDELYPKAYLGNMTQSQYALLVEYHSLSSDAQAAFIGRHPELYANPREKWLRTHPEENAILALMGQSSIYSTEALNQVSSLASSLDIPANALVMKDLDAVTELRLKHAKLFDLLDAYSGLDDEVKDAEGLTDRDRAIQSLYESNPEFRDDQRRIEALNVGTEKNPTLDSIVEGWVERGQIVDDFGASSAEAKLWLIDNKEVHQWALDNGLLTDTGEDWNENILRLNVAYREDFDQYDSYGDRTSPNYISGDTARADARKALLFDTNGKITSFGTAYYTKQALEKDFPENLITDYIDWYSVDRKDYEDDWWLMSHPEFYNTMLDMGIWSEPRDFSKVPMREVYALYQQYLDLPSGNPRYDFRAKHLDLDAWLVLKFGYKPIEGRGEAGAEPTPWEAAAAVKQFQEAFK